MDFEFQATQPHDVVHARKKKRPLSDETMPQDLIPDASPVIAWKKGPFCEIVSEEKMRDMMDSSDDENSDNETQEDLTEDDDELCPVITLPKEIDREIRKDWRKAVIIKLIGKSFPAHILYERLIQRWKLSGKFDFAPLGNGYYTVKFDNKRDRDYVLSEGPWVISDHYLSVRRWIQGFDVKTEALKCMDVWIKFPDLGQEFQNDAVLSIIGARVGTVREVAVTKSKIGVLSGRVCVSVDLTKPLLGKFRFKNQTQYILYEGVHLVCFNCGCFGHHYSNCPRIEDENALVNEGGFKVIQKTGEVTPPQENANFGPWMTVNRRKRSSGRKINSKNGKQNKASIPAVQEHSNPFTTLVSKDQEDYVSEVKNSLEHSNRMNELPSDPPGAPVVQARGSGQPDQLSSHTESSPWWKMAVQGVWRGNPSLLIGFDTDVCDRNKTWEPPPAGFLKINTDASRWNSGEAAAAGVGRDSKVTGFADSYGTLETSRS